MVNKHGVPLMIEEQAFNALSNKVFEGKEVTDYVTKYSDKTAVLSIHGPLRKKGSFFDFFTGASAYNDIAKEFKNLLKDDDIENIIFDIDSPGGMVNGCAELADLIYASRLEKNIISYISGYGCSAAYYLASAASKVYANKSATVGSIGVISSFIIRKDKNTKEIHIVSSKSKEKLIDVETKAGQEKIQADVDAQADIFMKDVSRYRELSLEAIEKTEGGTFLAHDALEMKLIDGVSELQTLLKEFEMEQSSQNQAVVEAKAEVKTEAVNAQEIAKRAMDITAKAMDLNLKGLGEKLVNSSMSAEEALDVLEATAKDVEQKAENDTPSLMPTGFDEVMDQVKNPSVGAKIEKPENDLSAEVDSYFQS